jgi:hypothetical protein
MQKRLKIALCQGIVDRNIAIVPWSIQLEDRLMATVVLPVLVVLALVERLAEALDERLAKALDERLAEASVVGREVQRRRTLSLQRCHQ